MTTVKLTAIGNSVGIIFSKELLARLHVDKGDMLYVIETAGGIELTPYDPKFARQMEMGHKVMREDRDVLRKLAE